MKVQIDLLWQGNKSCASQSETDLGLWVMPPCLGFDNIPGHAFARVSHQKILITDINRILVVSLHNRGFQSQVAHLATSDLLLGIAAGAGKVYSLVHASGKDYLLAYGQDGALLARQLVRDQDGKPRLLFNRHIHIHGPRLPFRLSRLPSGNLIILEPYDWRHLVEVDPEGTVVREWRNITGYTIRKGVGLSVSGDPRPTSRFLQRLPVPESLDAPDWRVIGSDRSGHLFWHRLVKSVFPSPPPLTWYVSETACCSSRGELRWRIILDGPDGVLARFAPTWHTFGEGGGGWVEIDSDGSVLALAVRRDEVVRNGCAIFRLKVS